LIQSGILSQTIDVITNMVFYLIFTILNSAQGRRKNTKNEF
jgi:hypothetical protein